MKAILASIALIAAAQTASANNLKTYDCVAKGSGTATVDKITLRASDKALVLNFPDFRVDQKYTASFRKVAKQDASSIPASIENKVGGTFWSSKNTDSLSTDDATLVPMWAFATWGITRHDDTGTLSIVYKRTDKNNSQSNVSEWTRNYACTQR
jgi:hypothetical protein